MKEPRTISLDAAPLDVTAAAGKPPTFAMVAYTGGALRVSGWPSPVVVDLAGIDLANQRIPVRLEHDAGQGVGHTTRIAVTGGKLIAEGIISRDTPAALDVVQSAKNGFPWQASIGARIVTYQQIRQGASVTVNGRLHEGPIILATRSTLGEISFVDAGADPKTSAAIAATRSTPMPENVSTTDTAAEQLRLEAAAEPTRIAKIEAVCGGRFAAIQAKAIAENWTPEKAELEVLRASRPQASNIHVHGGPEATGNVLEAALCLTGKLAGVEKAYDSQTLEAAAKHFRGLSIGDFLIEAAKQNGYSGRGSSLRGDLRGVLQAAFNSNMQASASSADVGGILSNVANKFLLQAYNNTEQAWRQIAAIRAVKDFKAVTSYRLNGTLQYDKVGPNGELHHAVLGEESFTNKADTYGRLLGLTRQDIINDDLGAFTQGPSMLGRGAGLKLNDVFWTAFLDNAAFFTAGNKNYTSGANTNLSVDSLVAANLLFDVQVDANNQPLGITPAILLVPSDLYGIAQSLYVSLEIRDTTASTKYPVANVVNGRFRPVASAYLRNTSYSGYSSKAWYLLANPADLATIEVAFLNGMESPTIEQSQADFDTLGIQMRGFHDFGVAKQDHRAGVKVKGEA